MFITMVDPSLFTLPYDHELCRHLAAAGHEVELVGRPLRAGEAPPSAPCYRVDAGFYPLSEGGLGRRLPEKLRVLIKGLEHARGHRALVRRLRRRPPDVVHVQWLPLPAVDGPALTRLNQLAPLVLTAHDASGFRGGTSDRLQRRWTDLLGRFQRVVVHTGTGRDALTDHGVAASAVTRCPHPALPLVRPVPPPPAGTDRLVVLFGEIKPYKGIDVAIRALARLPETVHLLVAGRPRMDTAPLKRLAAELGLGGRVEWIERWLATDELPELFARGHAFVLPYRAADASGVLALVAGLGRPVVASRVGAMADTVPDLGGRLVEPDDPEALAAALTEVLVEPEPAAALDDWSEAVAVHERVYAEARAVWTESR